MESMATLNEMKFGGNNFSLNTGDISLDISAKEFLKSLLKCESRAAADGDLTQAEVTDCFHQIKADQQ
jgi:hypothetical protein